MKARQIAIGVKPDGSAVALLVEDYAYEWPVAQVPALVQALRTCAAGEPAPSDVAGLVWTEGGAFKRIVLSDGTMRFTVKRRRARELAAALDEGHRQAMAVSK
jgi:hypothetical protein